MIYAYNELYLPLAQRVMGDMLDFAVNTLNVALKEFYKMFLVSGMAHQFEIGNPSYVAGKNGCEVARLVMEECGWNYPQTEDVMYLDKSKEYWIGWALAYYQWKSNRPFLEIEHCVPIESMYGMYPTLHEADISLYVEIMDEKCRESMERSRLRRLRAYANLSQRQLSEASGVALRQIQLFEQGQRDIAKTQGETLMKLARALNCKIEDLLI
ncbi:MAG: helix-turn-helix domain-containing protein [Agathobacter sp.]